MSDFVADILFVLKEYFIYLYPGAITFFTFKFARGKKLSEDKISVLKMLIISYLYVSLVGLFIPFDIMNAPTKIHIILIALSFVTPIILNIFSRFKWVHTVLKWLSINTLFNDNMLDVIVSQEKNDKKNGIALKIFMDDKGLMYEGMLRVHESDPNRDRKIALSGYRRYVYDEEGKRFVVKNDYNCDNSRWVVVDEKDISRIEIKYANPK